MSRPPPRGPNDRRVWTASAAVSSTAVMVAVVGAFSAHSEIGTARPGPVESAPTSDAATVPTSTPAVARSELFRARIGALRRWEHALLVAFAPPSPPATARTAGRRTLRIARGGSPQACLAQAVYYEARGEPADGQAAVAQVVLNRARSGRHPTDVCGVVFKGAAHPGCQFSFACDPRLAGRRREPQAWLRAEQVAAAALNGPGRPDLSDALNYHADSVRPRWAAQLARTVEIGRHIFYAAVRPAGRTGPVWGWPAPEARPAAPPSGA